VLDFFSSPGKISDLNWSPPFVPDSFLLRRVHPNFLKERSLFIFSIFFHDTSRRTF